MTPLLDELPAELLFEIQLYALSDALPCVNRRTYELFKSTYTSFRAEYIVGRFASHATSRDKERGIISYALHYPLCAPDVLEAVMNASPKPPLADPQPLLPKRLFRPLAPKSAKSAPWSREDAPLPFLHWLFNNARIRPPDPNAHDGYALTRAVHAGFVPLISFLLAHGALPRLKDALAVRIAIKKRDLALVCLLVERDDTQYTGSKRRRLTDRVDVNTAMLKLAVEVDARDIVEYLLDKGARPDMQTILRMRTSGFAP